MTTSFVQNVQALLNTSTNAAVQNTHQYINPQNRPSSVIYQRSIPKVPGLDVSKSQQQIQFLDSNKHSCNLYIIQPYLEKNLLSARTTVNAQIGDKSETRLSTLDMVNKPKTSFGIDGYKLPTVGLPPKPPQYSVPKDRLSNFLEFQQRRAKQLPGPADYKQEQKWEVGTVKLKQSAQRVTFTDEVGKKSRNQPSSASYSPLRKEKSTLGKISYYSINVQIANRKAEGFNFMSEAEFLGQATPSPASYKVKRETIEDRSPSYKIKNPSKEEKSGSSWKIKKTSLPDVGSYEVSKSVTLVKPKHPAIAFSKSKFLKFTVEVAKNKQHVPGAGQYSIEKAYSLVSLPYIKKRY